MKLLFSTPLDQVLADRWHRIDAAYRKAFLWALLINLLAFGYEMTKLTLNHDDVTHIFIQDTILGHYLGRFGLGWLHYYTQNAYFMPFLQMAEGMVWMSVYGLLIAKLWDVRKTADIVLINAVVSVFPFMTQIYQYNTAMATYPLAHVLGAAAVFLSVRGKPVPVALAALLYVAAFSIYQSVVANAATLFLLWGLATLMFGEARGSALSGKMIRSTLGALIAVVVGGVIYVAIVSTMDIQFDRYQEAGEAFTLSENISFLGALSEVVKGTRGFFLWPENYFPAYLKNLQLVFLAGAAALCVWIPQGLAKKVAALGLFGAALFAPRLLQIIHPSGHYHNLALTAYAVLIAGLVMIVIRAGSILARNLALVLASILIAGYILQCNWISTVDQLNTYAHTSTLNQIISRVWSLPAEQWDGGKVVVVGSYNMPAGYPFKGATGVATEYIDAAHMQNLARLMRKDINFVPLDKTMPAVAHYAATHPVWPHQGSVGAVDGVAVVVLSK